MTTITIDSLQATERMLDTYLTGLTETLEKERADRQGVRDNIRETAIQYGNNHSIEDDLDHLLVAIGLEPRAKKGRFYLTLRYEAVVTSPYDLRVDVTNHPNVSPTASYMGGTPVLSWTGQVSAQVEMPGTSRIDEDTCCCEELAKIDPATLLDRARIEYSTTYVPHRDGEGQYVGERGGEKYRIVGMELARCGWYYCPRSNPQQPEQRKDPIPLTMP